MKLVAVYFMPGVSIVTGVMTYHSSITAWVADKHPLLKCEEQKNGDVWFVHPDGRRSEVSALVIATRVRVPDAGLKTIDAPRRGGDAVKS